MLLYFCCGSNCQYMSSLLRFQQLTDVRQRLSIPVEGDAKAKPTVLVEDTHSLASYGIKASGSEIKCKDLGPQIAWRTVFLAEYVSSLIEQNPAGGLSIALVLNPCLPNTVRTHRNPTSHLRLVEERTHPLRGSLQGRSLFHRLHSRL